MASREIWVMGARLAFAQGVFEKTSMAGDSSSKPTYSFTLILADGHPQIAEIEQIEEELANEHQWKSKEKGADVLKSMRKKGKNALLDGDDKKKYDGFEGNRFLSCRSDKRPTVMDGRNREPLTAQDSVIYAGCYVNAKVSIWVQDNQYGQGINVEQTGLQFVRDGDSFGGGATPAKPDDFPDLDASGGTDDSLFS